MRRPKTRIYELLLNSQTIIFAHVILTGLCVSHTYTHKHTHTHTHVCVCVGGESVSHSEPHGSGLCCIVLRGVAV